MSERKVHYDDGPRTLCGRVLVRFFGPTMEVSVDAKDVTCRGCLKVARRVAAHWTRVAEDMDNG